MIKDTNEAESKTVWSPRGRYQHYTQLEIIVISP